MKQFIHRILVKLMVYINNSQVWFYLRFIFSLSVYINPTPTRIVRGVAIKASTPIDEPGILDAVKSWDDREPATFDWLDELNESDVLIDVGASMGHESLYAALKPHGPNKIFAFDIDLSAGRIFANNIQYNKISKIDFYFMALSDDESEYLFKTQTNKYIDDRSKRLI